MNNSLLSGFEPKGFFHWFEEISQIPRPSFQEEKITAFLSRFAKERNLYCKADAVGNVLIKLPATPGYEEKPAILLQGHLDMVCVKDEGVEFDFSKEPIQMRIEGNLLRACGTTLGADNGTGVATMLAQTYGADQEFAAGIVFMTSLCCIATIPVMTMLL